MGVLIVLEISKKQHYIFKTNKLKENIGASKIIEYATEILPEIICKKNNGEHVSTGGGRSYFLFDSMDQSKNFSREYSRFLLENYPSLEFFLANQEYNVENDKITEKFREAFAKLGKKKALRKEYSYITDLGICEKCSSTRLPAVAMEIDKKDGQKRYVSGEIQAKIKMANEELTKERKRFAIDITDLGITKNEKSYIAITHIDGNGMGKRVAELTEKYETKYNGSNKKTINDEYVSELKKFSEDTKTAYNEAFNKMVQVVENNIEQLNSQGLNIKKDVVPVRKVILAGDDVCYITDARIALECAAVFIKELEKHVVRGEKITACAGIAIVKEKYPFFKTYQLSEQLCTNAKRSIKDKNTESRIDWHILQGEYDNDLDGFRQRAYKTFDGKELSLRPLVVTETSDCFNNYSFFRKDLNIINNKMIARSKIKAMLNEMKKGERQLYTYIEINRLYNIMGSHRIGAKTGFYKDKCVIFDAVEAMDYFKELKLEGE